MSKILYIDDEKSNLIVLSSLLKDLLPDCTVMTAQSGKEGIKIANEEFPDAILLDIIMPEMDGFEVCRRLKSKKSTKHIPILMITGFKKDLESRIQGLEIGADAFLTKPYDKGELVAQINVLLRIKNAEDQLKKEKKILKNLLDHTLKELRESEEKYRCLAENTIVGIAIADMNDKLKYINPAMLKIFGYENPEEILSIPQKDLFTNESQSLLSNMWKNREDKKNTPSIFLDISIVKKDEEIRQLSLSQTRVTIGGEKLLQSSFIDITEQKQTKEALVLERSYFKQLFESAQEAIVMSDIDTKILRVNNEFTKMFGYTSEEVQGRIIDDIIIPKKAKREANSISKRVSTGDKIACEAVRCRKDGSLIDVSILASPIIIDNKQVGVYGIYRDISKRKQMENELLKSYKKLHNSLMSTVNTMASTFEIRDPYTTGHQQRVAKLACAIAEKMRLDEKQIEGIRIAGLLHDIGKIGIPAEILNKPARLTKDEFNFIKNHPQIAYDVLKKIDFPWPVAQMVLQHHEKLDGSGYPQGLSGKNILIEARILTVSDIVEAMSAHRPYRPALKLKIIFDEITINRNRLFDPNVVDACLILFKNQKFKHDWNKKG